MRRHRKGPVRIPVAAGGGAAPGREALMAPIEESPQRRGR
jgi:hypothetical protein